MRKRGYQQVRKWHLYDMMPLYEIIYSCRIFTICVGIKSTMKVIRVSEPSPSFLPLYKKGSTVYSVGPFVFRPINHPQCNTRHNQSSGLMPYLAILGYALSDILGFI